VGVGSGGGSASLPPAGKLAPSSSHTCGRGGVVSWTLVAADDARPDKGSVPDNHHTHSHAHARDACPAQSPPPYLHIAGHALVLGVAHDGPQAAAGLQGGRPRGWTGRA